MNEMVTSVKFAPETRCVSSIYPSGDRDRCAVAGIAQIAEVLNLNLNVTALITKNWLSGTGKVNSQFISNSD